MWRVLGVVGAFLAFTVLVVGVVWFGARDREHAFPARARALGLVESRQSHWIGSVEGRDVVVGRYGGTRRPAVGLGAGVLVIVRVGLLPGGRHGADLTDPPKVWGRGESDGAVEALLTPEVLREARGANEPSLFPANDLVVGNVLDLVIRDGWPAGWDGLGVRTAIPTNADTDQIRAAIRQLGRVSDALHRAART